MRMRVDGRKRNEWKRKRKKKLCFPMNTDTCGQGFSYWLCPPCLLFLVTFSHAPCTLRYINESEPRSMHLIVKNTLFFMHNAYFILTTRSTEPLGKSELRVKGN